MQRPLSVLIIDDDPVHLQIYGWILKSAGFRPMPILVAGSSIKMPENQSIDVAVLDYRLMGKLKAADAAESIHSALPNIPIILLLDIYDVPEDIAPHIAAFVRKGQPEKLIDAINQFSF